MHKTHLYLLIALGFLTFGMISCSQEENVVYQADSFRPDSVSTQNQDRSFFKNGSITQLELGGHLIFDQLQTHDFKTSPILFRIESECRNGSSSALTYNRVDFQNQKQIAVARLIPESLLGQLHPQEVECNFTITSTRGDSFSYNINNSLKAVQIKNLESFYNFPGEFENQYFSLNDFEAREIAPQQAGLLRLNCQDFTQTISDINAPLKLERMALLGPSITQHLKTSQQSCRFVFKGESSTLISGVFYIQFPVADLHIQGKVLKPVRENPLNKPAVLDFLITNPNTFAVEMRISKKSTSRFLYRPIYIGHLATLLGKTHKIPIIWKSDDVALQAPSDNQQDTVITSIPGQSTVVIHGIANKTLKCTAPKKMGVLVDGPKSPKFIAQNYDYILNSVFEFKQAQDTWMTVDPVPVGTPKISPHSDLQYWHWPNNEVIKAALGDRPLFNVWDHMQPINDLCTE